MLIEVRAGNCEKVRYVLPTLKPKCYIPIDVSAGFLFNCAENLQAEFPYINIHAVADDMKADDALSFLKHIRNVLSHHLFL